MTVNSETINVNNLIIGKDNDLAGILNFSAIALGDILVKSEITFNNSNIFANTLSVNSTSEINNSFDGNSLTIENIASASITGGEIKVNQLNIAVNTKGSVESTADSISIQNQITDSATASITNATINASELNINALSSSEYKASGVAAINDISGDVKAYISNSIINAGTGGVNINALDKSQITATSTGLDYNFTEASPVVSLDVSTALNKLNRSVEAYIDNGSDVTVTDGN